LADVVARELVNARAAAVVDASGADDATLAASANRFGADLFLGLRAGVEVGARVAYFELGRFRSEAGFRIAGAVQHALHTPTLVGRAYPVLRETRMAAVILELFPEGDADAAAIVVRRTGDVGRAIGRGIRRGFEAPGPDP
jgi:hypothetical protein